LLLCLNAFAQTRYPAEQNHSPITRQVAVRLQGIVANGQGKNTNRFIKVGDSITVAPSYFMGQFNSPDYVPGSSGVTRDLDRYEYVRTSMEYFLTGIIPDGPTTSFERETLAAQVGQTASWAVTGDPSPLAQELAAVAPSFAVIMYGTNDIGWYPDDHDCMSWIIQHLSEIVDHCIAEGTVPILKAPPPRVGYELKMLTLSHLIRALAQARQIPFINYHRAMMPLPDQGLGSDGMHPSVYAWNRHCHLTPTGLEYGTGMNNLHAIQGFDRALRATVGGAPALDFEPPALVGVGSQASPLQVDGIPLIDARATTAGMLDAYYAFTLTESKQLRFMVLYQNSTDVDVTLLNDSFGQIDSDDGQLDVDLDDGQYYLRIETRDGLVGNAGEYQMLIMDRTSTGMPSSEGIFIDGARATPAQINPSQSTTITFTVTALDDGSITGVALDLSELGGASSVAMTYLGNGSYSYTASFTVASEGEKLVTVTAEDDSSNQSSISVYVTVGTPPRTLTVTNTSVSGGSGTVTSIPAGIDCGGDCSQDFASATTVQLIATPDGSSSFSGWSGACSGTGTCDLTMDAEKLVTATFQSNIMPDIVIYDDALATGWQDLSYHNDTTINYSSTSPFKVGTNAALATSITAWGAFSPAMGSGSSTDITGYHALKFWVHGGSGDDKGFRLLISGSPNIPFTAVANTWTEITVTLSVLNDPPSISRLEFQNFSSSPISGVSFDHIRIVPPPLFADGFESGDTLRWSQNSP
jgi:hypothetical protein